MDARRKQELNELMVTAWNLARFGANRFGGPASLYFWMALRIAWRERGGEVRLLHEGQCGPDVDGDRAEAGKR